MEDMEERTGELEARAVEVEARAAEERVAATAARDGLVAAMAIAERREMGMEAMEERAVELEARAMEVETRAVERAARVEARARSHAEMEMGAAMRDREEARAACEAARRWWRFPGRRLAVAEMEAQTTTAESAVAMSYEFSGSMVQRLLSGRYPEFRHSLGSAAP